MNRKAEKKKRQKLPLDTEKRKSSKCFSEQVECSFEQHCLRFFSETSEKFRLRVEKKSDEISFFGKKYPRNVPLNTQNDFWTTLPKDFLLKTKFCYSISGSIWTEELSGKKNSSEVSNGHGGCSSANHEELFFARSLKTFPKVQKDLGDRTKIEINFPQSVRLGTKNLGDRTKIEINFPQSVRLGT